MRGTGEIHAVAWVKFALCASEIFAYGEGEGKFCFAKLMTEMSNRIYKLFASDSTGDLPTPSVLLTATVTVPVTVTVTVPVISLILSCKKPCLPEEDSREPSERESKIIE